MNKGGNSFAFIQPLNHSQWWGYLNHPIESFQIQCVRKLHSRHPRRRPLLQTQSWGGETTFKIHITMEFFLKSLCFSSIGVYFLLPPFCSLTSSRTQVSIFLSFSYLHLSSLLFTFPWHFFSHTSALFRIFVFPSCVVWYMRLSLNTSQTYSLRLEAWGRLRQKES